MPSASVIVAKSQAVTPQHVRGRLYTLLASTPAGITDPEEGIPLHLELSDALRVMMSKGIPCGSDVAAALLEALEWTVIACNKTEIFDVAYIECKASIRRAIYWLDLVPKD